MPSFMGTIKNLDYYKKFATPRSQIYDLKIKIKIKSIYQVLSLWLQLNYNLPTRFQCLLFVYFEMKWYKRLLLILIQYQINSFWSIFEAKHFFKSLIFLFQNSSCLKNKQQQKKKLYLLFILNKGHVFCSSVVIFLICSCSTYIYI